MGGGRPMYRGFVLAAADLGVTDWGPLLNVTPSLSSSHPLTYSVLSWHDKNSYTFY